MLSLKFKFSNLLYKFLTIVHAGVLLILSIIYYNLCNVKVLWNLKKFTLLEGHRKYFISAVLYTSSSIPYNLSSAIIELHISLIRSYALFCILLFCTFPILLESFPVTFLFGFSILCKLQQIAVNNISKPK